MTKITKLYKFSFYFLFIILFFINSKDSFSFLNSYQNGNIKNVVFEIKKDTLTKNDIILLDGEWEFYWKQLLTNQEIINNKFENKKIVYLPKSWNNLKLYNEKYPSNGFATYRLKIINNSNNDIAIRIGKIFTSTKVYINDELKYEVGKVSQERKNYKEDTQYKNIFIERELKEFYIVIQAANFNDNTGGIWESLLLGEREKIIKLTSKRYILESFVLGILLIMGLYHLIFYFIHKDDATFLIFGLFCILMAFRVISTGELIIKELFPFIGWIMMRKIEFFIFYVIVPMFLVFLYSLYPKEVKKRDVILIGSFGLFFGIVVLATQNGTYTKLVDFYQIITKFSRKAHSFRGGM